jgi:hypothetical protein
MIRCSVILLLPLFMTRCKSQTFYSLSWWLINISYSWHLRSALSYIIYFILFCLDIAKLQAACTKRSLDDSHLKIHSVTITNCVVVTGFTENTSQDTLEFYFDNKRRSGVEGVTSINLKKDEGQCFIFRWLSSNDLFVHAACNFAISKQNKIK